MKTIWSIIVAGAMSATGAMAAPTTQPLMLGQYEAEPTANTQVQATVDTQTPVDAVKSATSANAAMEAYSRAMAQHADSPELQAAYVRKMIDLDLPAEALTASQRLLSVAPDKALARSVIAFDEAKHGDLTDAMQDIVLAAQKMPDDPFIAKQAASILAWYDSVSTKPVLSRAVQAILPDVRRSLEAQQVYAQTYKSAADFYHQAAANAQANANNNADMNAANPPQPPAANNTATAPNYQPMGADTYYGGDTTYAAPYPYQPYATTYYSYPYPTYAYDYPYYCGTPYAYYGCYPYVGLNFNFGYGYGYGHGFYHGFNRGFIGGRTFHSSTFHTGSFGHGFGGGVSRSFSSGGHGGGGHGGGGRR